jgi:hypothetical protein
VHNGHIRGSNKNCGMPNVNGLAIHDGDVVASRRRRVTAWACNLKTAKSVSTSELKPVKSLKRTAALQFIIAQKLYDPQNALKMMVLVSLGEYLNYAEFELLTSTPIGL